MLSSRCRTDMRIVLVAVVVAGLLACCGGAGYSSRPGDFIPSSVDETEIAPDQAMGERVAQNAQAHASVVLEDVSAGRIGSETQPQGVVLAARVPDGGAGAAVDHLADVFRVAPIPGDSEAAATSGPQRETVDVDGVQVALVLLDASATAGAVGIAAPTRDIVVIVAYTTREGTGRVEETMRAALAQGTK